jgi:hypothetical protein
MLYRIITERKNKFAIAIIMSQYFPAFTLLDGEGYWKSNPEPSLIIEVETDDLTQVTIAAIAIKWRNGQENVMIQEIRNAAWLV